MNSWWQLGENREHFGEQLNMEQITCPFCMERGNFSLSFHAEKKKPNSDKRLNFDTFECGNCKGYVMVLWSPSTWGLDQAYHGYQVLPWPLKLENYPKHWPEQVGRFWLQTKRNVRDGNWDAASLMARSALQLALRDCKAEGRNLKQEIDDLAVKGILPPIMKDWSDQVRELGNDSAHPAPSQDAANPQDVRDIVAFLDFLLEYLYTLPYQIQNYRERSR